MEGYYYEKIADDLSQSLRFFRHHIQIGKEGDGIHVVPHYHSAFEISYVAEGEYKAHIGDGEYLMRKGDLAFVDPLTVHSYTTHGNALVYAVIFDGAFFSALGLKQRTFPVIMKDMYLLKEIFDDVGRGCKTHEELLEFLKEKGEDYKLGVLLSVLGIVMQKVKPIEKSLDRGAELMVSVLHYIEQNYTRELTLDSLSAHFGYAKNYFSKRFNEYVGMSIREYLNRKRISYAIDIVKEHADVPLCKVAEMVGYRSWNTFYRAYERYYKNC
ncbi:MAG: helix-turn-helix transcriptional regulator [Clostridia bacterium]|nr:helix-turn-helix transcriptional regulator [Clostridia bacterium]